MSNLPVTVPVAAGRPRAARHRPWAVLVASDALAWVVALTTAVLLRYELHMDEVDLSGLAGTATVAAVVQLAVGAVRRAYTLDRLVSVRGNRGIIASVFLVGAAVFVSVALSDPPPVPRSTPLLAIPIAALLLTGTRGAIRAWQERPDLDDPRRTHRAVVVGTGDDAE